MVLLKRVAELLEERCFVIENLDATVIAQRPKLLPYMDQMRANIAQALSLSEDRVNIKATTEEGLGFTGSEEGVASQAICSLSRFYENSMMVSECGASRCEGCAGRK